MRVNAFEPTAAEIGDYNSIMANAYRRERERRAQYFAKPVQKPVENKVIILEKPIVEPRPRNAETKYALAIQGPCLPDHPKFPFYNGERDIIEIASAPVKIEDCIKFICGSEKVPRNDLLGPWRHKHIVSARQKAMWLARKHSGKSFPSIGRHFGRDWTTVIHAVRRVDEMIQAQEWTPPELDQLIVEKAKHAQL